MTVDLHVGYVGITRDGDRVEIIKMKQPRNGADYFIGDNGFLYTNDGSSFLNASHGRSIIGPWIEPEAVKIHVGYVGVTRGGVRTEIVQNRSMTPYRWVSDIGSTYRDNGSFLRHEESQHDIIGPWVEPEKGENK